MTDHEFRDTFCRYPRPDGRGVAKARATREWKRGGEGVEEVRAECAGRQSNASSTSFRAAAASRTKPPRRLVSLAQGTDLLRDDRPISASPILLLRAHVRVRSPAPSHNPRPTSNLGYPVRSLACCTAQILIPPFWPQRHFMQCPTLLLCTCCQSQSARSPRRRPGNSTRPKQAKPSTALSSVRVRDDGHSRGAPALSPRVARAALLEQTRNGGVVLSPSNLVPVAVGSGKDGTRKGSGPTREISMQSRHQAYAVFTFRRFVQECVISASGGAHKLPDAQGVALGRGCDFPRGTPRGRAPTSTALTQAHAPHKADVTGNILFPMGLRHVSGTLHNTPHLWRWHNYRHPRRPQRRPNGKL